MIIKGAVMLELILPSAIIYLANGVRTKVAGSIAVTRYEEGNSKCLGDTYPDARENLWFSEKPSARNSPSPAG